MKKLPIIALIGQTNAGKSSLLNRFARKNIAIVAREAGTTRDNVTARIEDSFLMIDTAGLKNPEDDFEANIQDQISDAIEAADVILLTPANILTNAIKRSPKKPCVPKSLYSSCSINLTLVKVYQPMNSAV